MNNLFAFPVDGPMQGQFENPGMTLRDYFAARAMLAVFDVSREDDSHPGESLIESVARNSYILADAMLEAREAVDDE